MKKPKEELSVIEAVDELSKIAEIDHSLTGSELENREIKQEKVKQTFRVLHNYLKHVYEQDKEHLEDPQTRHGVQAIMVMASEAAKKIDRFTVLFKGAHGEGGVQQLQEFQDLQDFYLTKIMKKFEATLASEEAWQAEWGGQEVDLLDIQRRGLKDLETVRRDKEYELFFIRKEDGRPFFNRNLMRHIKLVGELDESISDPSGEDPFLKIKAIEDVQLHAGAKQFLEETKSLTEAFFKEAFKHKDSAFIAELSKALMALYLAANPRNLMQNTTGKSAVLYFSDFHLYLRRALQVQEYQEALENRTGQIEPFITMALQLAHRLSAQFFLRKLRRDEATGFLLKIFEKATHRQPLPQEGKNPLWLWNHLLEEDETLHNFLKHYPNGPLMKTLDVVREIDSQIGFDSIANGNFPYVLFRVEGGVISTEFLHLPAPLVQTRIDQVQVLKEFQAFLRGLAQKGKKEKLLLINLQNRTSWQEHARANALEELQKNAEFTEQLVVITFPMDTDFYNQSENYETLDEAKIFIGQLVEQLTSGEGCGYFFPAPLIGKELEKFSKKCCSTIHHWFFGDKKQLTRKNRLDFIELFYLFLTLYFIEKIRPDFTSYTCKDAIDTGAVMSAAMFSLLKVLGRNPEWKDHEKHQLLYLLYGSSLMLRERAVDKSRLLRFVSALSLVQAELEAKGEVLRKELDQLFDEPIFHLINLEEIS
ncbi:MAG: hypothetical protein KGZ39_02720 [Simkania sp.]|nr:hypothetical protein [Simkania sp.]